MLDFACTLTMTHPVLDDELLKKEALKYFVKTYSFKYTPMMHTFKSELLMRNLDGTYIYKVKFGVIEHA